MAISQNLTKAGGGTKNFPVIHITEVEYLNIRTLKILTKEGILYVGMYSTYWLLLIVGSLK